MDKTQHTNEAIIKDTHNTWKVSLHLPILAPRTNVGIFDENIDNIYPDTSSDGSFGNYASTSIFFLIILLCVWIISQFNQSFKYFSMNIYITLYL